jgi:hypothetical protein
VIVYEVNLRVRREIADDYRTWLHLHVAQMLALPGVVSAEIFAVPEHDDAARVAMCAQYRMRDSDALDAYLRDHAARMRADGVARFGSGFSAERRVLLPLDA